MPETGIEPVDELGIDELVQSLYGASEYSLDCMDHADAPPLYSLSDVVAVNACFDDDVHPLCEIEDDDHISLLESHSDAVFVRYDFLGEPMPPYTDEVDVVKNVTCSSGAEIDTRCDTLISYTDVAAIITPKTSVKVGLRSYCGPPPRCFNPPPRAYCPPPHCDFSF